MFYFDEIGGKKILKSDLIKNAKAFFTTRDICICCKNDSLEAIEKTNIENNKKIICDYLNIEKKNLLSPTQTHTSNIEIAKEDIISYPDTDALILTDKKLGIFLNFADCTPVILYDEKQNIGAIAHAGWRGTAENISSKTVQKMITDFNSKAENIVALIGPAIGFCCYNVGEEVYQQLSQTVSNFEGLYEIREGNIFVDLKNINKRQLEEIGIKKLMSVHIVQYIITIYSIHTGMKMQPHTATVLY